MRLSSLILFVFLLPSVAATAQTGIIFSKAQHDFGLVAKSSLALEQDFLFRNTSANTASVSSAISSSRFLEAIHTRSQIEPGEYGFVKLKLTTDSIDGLFNEYIEVEIASQAGIHKERIYVRAEVDPKGAQGQQRSFTDSEIALTVEVSPDDIADMEGFMGEDKLAQAETEIAYLRRQIKLQSELLFRFNEDLKEKQHAERENLEQLANLEKGIRENRADEAILAQIDALSERLIAIQQSDQDLRAEFSNQAIEYERLKHEADSARAYAEQLSIDLSERFKAEAAAIERAQKLEADLEHQQNTEQLQLQRIDSLEALVNQGGVMDQQRQSELHALRSALEAKEREHELQQQHALQQQQRMDRLQDEKQLLEQREDSLAASVTAQNQTNETLQRQLRNTESRISGYESRIDSLTTIASEANEATDEIALLQGQLEQLETEDKQLKARIAHQQDELSTLEEEREKAAHDLEAMERATSRQLEEAHKLLYRINQLSSREGQARLEVMELKDELEDARIRETEANEELESLRASLETREKSIEAMKSNLSGKANILEDLTAEQQDLSDKLTNSSAQLNRLTLEKDSMSSEIQEREARMDHLQGEVSILKNELAATKEKEAQSEELRDQLSNELSSVRMNNELTFDEMRSELQALSTERDEFRQALQDSNNELAQLRKELKESRQREKAAVTFAQELGAAAPSASSSNGIESVFRVFVMASSSRVVGNKLFEGHNHVHEFRENGRYMYALGEFSELSDAEEHRKKLASEGFGLARVIAFRGDRKISVSEAMETALD